MDFTKLRAQAMRSEADEEAVTVNTRALIDKVLARYSGEWTTLRELIQNAADAQATTVKIKFETLPSAQIPVPNSTSESEILKHVLLNHTLKTLMVVNDGQTFGRNDWSRLKRIAEGNPDETKIGAFGVGFYSVFADCEEPFVSSGKEAMAFFWKGNSLFTRRIQVPEQNSQAAQETTFVLDYRNKTSPVPNLLSICKFLATSLTFVALNNIELWLDDWKILSLQKKVSPSISIPISKDVDTTTKEGLMKVRSLDRESVQMDAAFMNIVGWKPSSSVVVSKSSSFGENQYGDPSSEVRSLRSFFSRLTTSSSHASIRRTGAGEEKAFQEIVLENLTAMTTANVFLQVTTASIRTSISTSFAAELERATKKPPPTTTKVAILTSSYDEAAASKAATKNDTVARNVDVFVNVLPREMGGKIYIGFPTAQTVGAGMHLSAPSVIPTVERESIDLNARWVRTWNIEMLRVAGIMGRLTFASEMNLLSESINRTTENGRITKDVIRKFSPEALHILNNFTFGASTPSAQVAQIIEEAFWTTYKKASIEIYSTKGVLQSSSVRFATSDFSGFVEGIPVIPEGLANSKFVTKLKDFGLITEITVGDVKKELGAKALTKDQLIHFITWAGRKAITGDIDAATIHDLLDSAVATVGEQDQGEIITLSTIKYYRNPNKVPPEVPGPPSALPFEITRSSPHNELQALGWQALEIVPWLRFLVESINGRNGLASEHDITWSPKFAAQVLAILSKQWEPLGPSSRETVVSLLKPLTVIPTKFGMKVPTDAYFSNVKLFDDLPVVAGCQGVKEKMLAALGVRKTVDLDTIFQRLLHPASAAAETEKSAPKWSHVELITYLASVKDDIPADDLKKLRATPICAAEAGSAGQEASQGTAKHYKISELFEPTDALRQLGLPILQWPGKVGYRANSQEGRFLTFLGLRPFPSVPELVNMMASSDASTRSKAMSYFIANHYINRYSSSDIQSLPKAILPLQGDEKRLVPPVDCFTNEKASLLGFDILRRDLVPHAMKFGVAENPPMTACINRIIAKPPQSRREAISLFGYFSTRLGEIGQNHATKLGDACIVPIIRSSQSTEGKILTNLKHISPRMCFIGDPGKYRDIFDFVDFSTEANTFLLHCGSKHEPSQSQVASMLASEPARILGIVQSPDKYLSLLRMLANALPELKKDKSLYKQMKASPFLLAIRRIPGNPDEANEKYKKGDNDEEDEEDDETGIQQYLLQPASKIVIGDDYTASQLFKEALLCAPSEEILEKFYLSLGSSTISSLVQEDIRLGSVLSERGAFAMKIQKRILERSKLFLHEFPPDAIRHNARWLEKNLTVEMVSSITLTRTLRGYAVSHTVKQTATPDPYQRKGWVLCLTPTHDMYHVSQALVSQLLSRPNNQAAVTLELLLTSDLQGLKRRGYNVDRILRAQAVDAHIAENERQKQLEAEQRQLKEQEEQWKQSQQIVPAAVREERRKSGQVAMPGAFGTESPEGSPVPKQKRSKGLFSGLTQRLGLDPSGSAQQQLQNFLGGGSGRTDDHDDEISFEDDSKAITSQPQPGRKPRGGTEKVTSPHALNQNLVNAIQASRAHDSSTLFSPPQTNQVKEEATYCDAKPSHNIMQVGDAHNGMRIYVAKDLTIPNATFLSQNVIAINAFAGLLYEVGDVFNLPRRALHMFYDESGSTIAFNSQGSIFCNFRFFSQLHDRNMTTPEGKVESSSWWWIVVAHELAHNLVRDHSAEHSYYTEMFIARYFPKMMARAASYAQSNFEARQIESRPQSLLD
ncbi:MAG: hypothetical protein M1818_005907 [Claussenomyces sp. TS43310]|nr:MAG: hypothetical protein M1818_005907 [Claussenomyces sp. TS43310]